MIAANPVAQDAVQARPHWRQEAVRNRIVNLIFAIYWLLILEGVLRKWAWPELKNALFFVRVPITLAVYWMALQHRRWPKTTWPLLIAYAFAAASFVILPIQFVDGGYDDRYFLIAGAGWINYFYYIPLAFIVADQFDSEDLRRLIRHSFVMAVLSVPFVLVQFFSAPNSAINLGTGADEATQFKNLGSALGYVRPTGLFSSTLGQSYFVASVATFVLFAWLLPPKDRPSGRIWLAISTLAVLIMTVFSQSRTLFFMLALVLLSGVIAGIVTKSRQMLVRSGVWPLLLIGITIVLWPVLFPEAFEAFAARWSGAQETELQQYQYGVFGRAFVGFYTFLIYWDDTPLLGYLLGLAGNAASTLPWVQLPPGYDLVWAEDGWSRHIVELGPVLGLGFILYRVALTIWVARQAALATRASGNPLPILLFGFVGLICLNGQISGHGTTNGYTWLFVGLTLAATRVHQRVNADYTEPGIARDIRRYSRSLSPVTTQRHHQ